MRSAWWSTCNVGSDNGGNGYCRPYVCRDAEMGQDIDGRNFLHKSKCVENSFVELWKRRRYKRPAWTTFLGCKRKSSQTSLVWLEKSLINTDPIFTLFSVVSTPNKLLISARTFRSRNDNDLTYAAREDSTNLRDGAICGISDSSLKLCRLYKRIFRVQQPNNIWMIVSITDGNSIITRTMSRTITNLWNRARSGCLTATWITKNLLKNLCPAISTQAGSESADVRNKWLHAHAARNSLKYPQLNLGDLKPMDGSIQTLTKPNLLTPVTYYHEIQLMKSSGQTNAGRRQPSMMFHHHCSFFVDPETLPYLVLAHSRCGRFFRWIVAVRSTRKLLKRTDLVGWTSKSSLSNFIHQMSLGTPSFLWIKDIRGSVSSLRYAHHSKDRNE